MVSPENPFCPESREPSRARGDSVSPDLTLLGSSPAEAPGARHVPPHEGTFQRDGVIPFGTCGMWGSPKPSQGVHPDPGALTRSPRCLQPQPVPQQLPVSPPALSHLGPAAPKCKRRPPSYHPSPQNLPIPCLLLTLQIISAEPINICVEGGSLPAPRKLQGSAVAAPRCPNHILWGLGAPRVTHPNPTGDLGLDFLA